MDSRTMRARLSTACVQSWQACLSQFRTGRLVHIGLCHRLLCLMAAAYPVVQLGHMRPFQWWTKCHNVSPHCHPQRFLCSKTMEKTPVPSEKSPVGSVSSSQNIMTDASLRGWEAVHQGCPVRGVWSGEQRSWHINNLELLAVFLALRQFLTQLTGCHVLIRTDNMTVVSYLNRQGGLRSRPLYRLARSVYLWAKTKFLSDRVVHIPGNLNSGADLLSRQRMLDGEWRLYPQVVNLIWQMCQWRYKGFRHSSHQWVFPKRWRNHSILFPTQGDLCLHTQLRCFLHSLAD